MDDGVSDGVLSVVDLIDNGAEVHFASELAGGSWYLPSNSSERIPIVRVGNLAGPRSITASPTSSARTGLEDGSYRTICGLRGFIDLACTFDVQ